MKVQEKQCRTASRFDFFLFDRETQKSTVGKIVSKHPALSAMLMLWDTMSAVPLLAQLKWKGTMTKRRALNS